MTFETLITGSENLNASKPKVIDIQRSHQKHSLFPVINKTGGSLTCYKNVALDGRDATTDLPQVVLCTASLFPYLIGLLVFEEVSGDESSLDNNAIGFVMEEGFANFDTSSFSTDAPLWLSGSGDFTATPQTGMPPIARVKVAAAAGSGGCIYYNRNGVRHSDAELLVSTHRIDGISNTAATVLHYLVACPGKFRVKRAYLLSDTATSGSTGSAEYRFMLRNHTDGVDLQSAAKITSSAEIAVGTIYDLGVDLNQTLSAASKVLRLSVQTVGTPAVGLNTARVHLVIEWQPIV